MLCVCKPQRRCSLFHYWAATSTWQEVEGLNPLYQKLRSVQSKFPFASSTAVSKDADTASAIASVWVDLLRGLGVYALFLCTHVCVCVSTVRDIGRKVKAMAHAPSMLWLVQASARRIVCSFGAPTITRSK